MRSDDATFDVVLSIIILSFATVVAGGYIEVPAILLSKQVSLVLIVGSVAIFMLYPMVGFSLLFLIAVLLFKKQILSAVDYAKNNLTELFENKGKKEGFAGILMPMDQFAKLNEIEKEKYVNGLASSTDRDTLRKQYAEYMKTKAPSAEAVKAEVEKVRSAEEKQKEEKEKEMKKSQELLAAALHKAEHSGIFVNTPNTKLPVNTKRAILCPNCKSITDEDRSRAVEVKGIAAENPNKVELKEWQANAMRPDVEAAREAASAAASAAKWARAEGFDPNATVRKNPIEWKEHFDLEHPLGVNTPKSGPKLIAGVNIEEVLPVVKYETVSPNVVSTYASPTVETHPQTENPEILHTGNTVYGNSSIRMQDHSIPLPYSNLNIHSQPRQYNDFTETSSTNPILGPIDA